MRDLDKIILHCSATEPDHDITVADVNRWHRARGWKEIGYHFLIRLDGTIERGRDIDLVGAHCKGHNATTIGICYAGGVQDGKPTDTMTSHQEMALLSLVNALKRVFGDLPLHGHNEFSSKACPSFDVGKKYPWLRNQNQES